MAMHTIRSDLRFALRTLRRNLAFALLTAATLAIGIGAATIVYSVVDGAIGLTHHQASVEVVDTRSGSADGPEPRVSTIRWTADLLPDDLAPTVRAMMEQGATAIARTLGAGAPAD